MKGNLMEEKKEEKKVLSIEDIESQTLLELPDRSQTDIVATIVAILFNLGGGGGGGAGGSNFL
jgi:hypothetical protein